MSAARIVLVAVLLTAFGTSESHARILGKTAKGNVPIQSIDVLSFAPDGILLIGDGQAQQIVAVRTGDLERLSSAQKKIEAVDSVLAASVGTSKDGIEIIDLAVNPDSGRTYAAVRKQDNRQYIILTIDRSGTIEEFSLSDAEYAVLSLKSDESSRVNKVTDVAWADDRVIAAGRSNEEFSSKIFSISAPLHHQHGSSSFSAKTYHVSHRRWETKAPMSVVIPLREDNRTWVVGAFSCTPIVKYPIDAIEPGAVVKGSSMIELGSGNRPLDMFAYEKAGKAFLLANTFRFHHERAPFGPSPYWTVKFDQSLLSGSDTVNEQAVRRLDGRRQPVTDRIEMIEAFHGVMHMDKLDDSNALVIRQADDGLILESLPLP